MHYIIITEIDFPSSFTLTEEPIVGYQNPTAGAPTDDDFSKTGVLHSIPAASEQNDL